MSQKKMILSINSIVIILSFALSACGTQSEAVTLKVALLPVLDTLSVHVAAEEGYFEEQGVQVEIIPVASAPERDQLIAAGEADGMLNEIVSTLFHNKNDVQVQIVRTARAATSEAPLFRILAVKDSGIESVEDLRGVDIGISEGTVIAYLTDRLLEAEGFSDDDITTIAVPKIPDRLALLGSGELQAAMLPDPASSLAIMNGATVVIDDTRHPEFGLSVFSFRKEVIEAQPEAIEAFLAAVEQAIAAINANPEEYADLMAEKGLVPAPLVGEYQVNPLPTASVPSQAQWDDAVAWALREGLIEAEIPYAESVTADYLP